MRLYLRPTGLAENHEGALQLAGGMVRFTAYEVITVSEGRRTCRLVPADRLDTLPPAARVIANRITAPRPPMKLGNHILDFSAPRVMGILNMTPDSFSDGGAHIGDAEGAIRSGLAMAGAAIIDVGGESTRPGAATVPDEEEIARTEPVIRGLVADGAIVSIDTRKASVMAAALEAGAHIVNDVSALDHDPDAAVLLASNDCPVVLMHHQGTPATMQQRPHYDDVLIEVYDWLADRIAFAEAAGIARSRILVDPGIGFGKTLQHNLQLLAGLALFHGLGCPILLGASRKRIIGYLSNDAPADQRLGGSLALALHGAQMGVQLLRVHDVPETVQALQVWSALREGANRTVDR